MSRINGSSCLDVNSGRPQADANYQNFKVNANTSSSKVSACEVSAAVVMASY